MNRRGSKLIRWLYGSKELAQNGHAARGLCAIRVMLVPILTFCALAGCGYHVGGQAVTIPKGIQTIAIPAFVTVSTRYRLIDLLPQEVGREFNTRTRFRVINDPSIADAVLRGNINSATTGAAVYDPQSGKATVVAVSVVVSLTMSERATGRVLFTRPSLSFRQNYNIAVDPHQFFDESGPAFDRVSRDLARDIVSAVMADF